METILISADFSLDDACKSAAAERKCIDNRLDDVDIMPRLQALAAAILQPILDHFGHPPAIGSFYRCKKLNLEVGGAANSQHVRGEAVDIEMPGMSNVDFARWISTRLKFDQLILEYHTLGVPTSGWVHVSYVDETAPENVKAGRKNRGEILTMGKGYSFHGLPA